MDWPVPRSQKWEKSQKPHFLPFLRLHSKKLVHRNFLKIWWDLVYIIIKHISKLQKKSRHRFWVISTQCWHIFYGLFNPECQQAICVVDLVLLSDESFLTITRFKVSWSIFELIRSKMAPKYSRCFAYTENTAKSNTLRYKPWV